MKSSFSSFNCELSLEIRDFVGFQLSDKNIFVATIENYTSHRNISSELNRRSFWSFPVSHLKKSEILDILLYFRLSLYGCRFESEMLIYKWRVPWNNVYNLFQKLALVSLISLLQNFGNILHVRSWVIIKNRFSK